MSYWLIRVIWLLLLVNNNRVPAEENFVPLPLPFSSYLLNLKAGLSIFTLASLLQGDKFLGLWILDFATHR